MITSDSGRTLLTLTATDCTLPPLPVDSVEIEATLRSPRLRIVRRAWFHLDEVDRFARELRQPDRASSALESMSPGELRFVVSGTDAAGSRTVRVEVHERGEFAGDATSVSASFRVDSLEAMVRWLRRIASPAELFLLGANDWDEDKPVA